MFPNLDKAFTLISDRIALCEDRQSVIDYLDSLESRICELPYGDILYEHAYEIASVRLWDLK